MRYFGCSEADSASRRFLPRGSPLPIEVGLADLLGLVEPVGSIDENGLDSDQSFDA